MAEPAINSRPRREHRESARVRDNGDPLHHKVSLTRKEALPPSVNSTTQKEKGTEESLDEVRDNEGLNSSQPEDEEDIPRPRPSRTSSTKTINLLSDEDIDTENDDTLVCE